MASTTTTDSQGALAPAQLTWINLFAMHHLAGLTVRDIAKRANTSTDLVYAAFKDTQVGLRADRRSPCLVLKDGLNEENLRRLHCDEDRSVRDIADLLNVSDTHVYRLFKEYGIERRSSERRPHVAVAEVLTKDVLTQLLHEEGLRVREVADRFGCTRGCVYGHMRLHGVKATARNETHRPAGLNRANVEKWYYSDMETVATIADRLGTAKRTVLRFMDEQGLERR